MRFSRKRQGAYSETEEGCKGRVNEETMGRMKKNLGWRGRGNERRMERRQKKKLEWMKDLEGRGRVNKESMRRRKEKIWEERRKKDLRWTERENKRSLGRRMLKILG